MKYAGPCPVAVKIVLPCSLHSERFLTFPNTELGMHIIEMTACCVMRLAVKGHGGWVEVSRHVYACGRVDNLELRLYGGGL